MESNDHKEPVSIDNLNMIIEKMGHKGTYINSCIIHPTYEYNELDGDFKINGFVYDIDVLSDETTGKIINIFNDLSMFTSIVFIFSSFNNQGYVESNKND